MTDELWTRIEKMFLEIEQRLVRLERGGDNAVIGDCNDCGRRARGQQAHWRGKRQTTFFSEPRGETRFLCEACHTRKDQLEAAWMDEIEREQPPVQNGRLDLVPFEPRPDDDLFHQVLHETVTKRDVNDWLKQHREEASTMRASLMFREWLQDHPKHGVREYIQWLRRRRLSA